MEETFDEDFEAQLYAQAHHDTSVEPAVPESSDYTPPNLNKQSGKRYWQKSKNLSTQNSYYDQQTVHNTYTPEKTQPKTPIAPKAPQVVLEDKEISAAPAIKSFVPYSSVLTFMSAPSEPPPPRNDASASVVKANSYEKKKTKTTKFPKAGKLFNPVTKQGVTQGKSAMKLEVQAKKLKATAARKKAQSKVIATIELDDSDESDCIPIELPPPPLIMLDSSDEETMKKKRAMSPSTSSIISDDFIVAGDKRRLVNPFTNADDSPSSSRKSSRIAKQKEVPHKKETIQKLKALTKVPSSTSSSDSARSSCERNVEVPKIPTAASSESRARRKVSNSLDNSAEDSIYCAKSKSTKSSTERDKDKQSSDSDEETPCVNAKNQKLRRRKSTNSRKKSTDGDSDKDEDPKQKLIASTPIPKKRSRFITPSYNDHEFATLISSIIRSDVLEDEDIDEYEQETESPEAKKAVSKSKSKPTSTETSASSSKSETSVAPVTSQEDDCLIIEQPSVVIEVPDEEEPVVSDSDDSMKNFKAPVACDLSLNVTQIPYEPHEYIRNPGERSREIPVADESLVNPEVGWNDEMKFFYDGSWGNEDFCISSVLESMPREQRHWKINNADRNRTMDGGSRIRCKKCNEVGHIAVKCTKPRKRIVCYMCGEEGHRETRCPNSICLRCGKPNRLFATICQGCQSLSRKICPCCRYQGHDMEQCPDKWRRYHSTTTDTDTLGSDFQINKRVYCSICARRGHFAENCQQFFKTISGLITSSCASIVSHKPSYPRQYLQRFSDQNGDQKQLLALFTYFPYYRFNFNFASFTRIYSSFKEQFVLHMQRTAHNRAQALPAIENAEQKKRNKQQKRRDAKRQKRLKEPTENFQISLSPSGSRTVKGTPPTAHEDSNSNYDFSEFYVPPQQSQQSQDNDMFKSPGVVSHNSFEKAIKAVKEKAEENPILKALESIHLVKNPLAVAISLPDFIPLTRPYEIENQPQKALTEREPEKVGDAQVMLTKEHYKMLNCEKGMNFLFDLHHRLDVVSQFQWDKLGNFLVVTGTPSNQSMFHLEVREYMYQIELDRHVKLVENTSQLPRNKTAIVSFLKNNLQSINKMNGQFWAKRMFDTMQEANKHFNQKKALKCRRALNIAFFGDAELQDGGSHINILRRILKTLEQEIAQDNLEMNTALREEISQHMKPIFSAMDHGDYSKLLEQYMNVMKKRRKRNPANVMN